MDLITIILSLFIFLGLLALIIGQINIAVIIKQLKKQKIQISQWFILSFLVSAFIIGYIIFFIFMLYTPVSMVLELISLIFLGGGIFVMLITLLSRKTLRSIYKAEQLRQLNEELKYLSEHDDLTDLYRRKYFETRVAKAILTIQNSDKQYSILYIDLNHFKQINDTYGHMAGDQVLIRVALLLKSFFRKTDIISRLGGDEFAILLPSANYQIAMQILTKLKNHIKDVQVVFQNHTIPISMAIGAAEITANSQANEIINQADIACYEDKKRDYLKNI